MSLVSRPPTLPYRLAGFLLAIGVSMGLFRAPLALWIRLSLDNPRYSCVSILPLVAAALIVWRRAAIFVRPRTSLAAALAFLATGAALFARYSPPAAPGTTAFSLQICAIVLLWIAAFLLCFGLSPACRAAFPLGLLFLAVPVPLPCLLLLVRFLQHSSAAAAAMLFHLFRIPALRQDLFFSLPGFDIEIAEQCSGIRSSTSLVLAGSVAGYLFLRNPASRLLLILVTVPLVILRNGLRIVTLSGLALYVSQGFLYGRLHHYGGLVFSLLDVAVLAPLLLRLHGAEHRGRETPKPASANV